MDSLPRDDFGIERIPLPEFPAGVFCCMRSVDLSWSMSWRIGFRAGAKRAARMRFRQGPMPARDSISGKGRGALMVGHVRVESGYVSWLLRTRKLFGPGRGEAAGRRGRDRNRTGQERTGQERTGQNGTERGRTGQGDRERYGGCCGGNEAAGCSRDGFGRLFCGSGKEFAGKQRNLFGSSVFLPYFCPAIGNSPLLPERWVSG